MNKETQWIDTDDLKSVVHQKLVEAGVVLQSWDLELQPCHPMLLHGRTYFHYVISSPCSKQKYFLKMTKDVNYDGSHLCNEYLQEIGMRSGNYAYPVVIVPVFCYHGNLYFITTFVEGRDLDHFVNILPEYEWDSIADKILFRVNELSGIHTSQFSERGQFLDDGCATILERKILERYKHPLISSFPHERLNKVFDHCCSILDGCDFSVPTLIHMDIKPANIIYNPEADTISLIDFEFARFGDMDFGWTQMLLSGHNHFSDVYKERVVPRMASHYLTLAGALEIPKFQCYIFYQTMCNLIYYFDRNLGCPRDFESIFTELLNKL